jgi:hypothetical protein
MNKSSAQDQTPGGFEGGAGGSKGNPTPTAKSTALAVSGIHFEVASDEIADFLAWIQEEPQ